MQKLTASCYEFVLVKLDFLAICNGHKTHHSTNGGCETPVIAIGDHGMALGPETPWDTSLSKHLP
jgi:hypothetical protein